MEKNHLVFVFGTLKEGFPNFSTNKGIRLPGEFQTLERFPLYLVGERLSPWMIATPGEGTQVQGQVFSVSDATLADMDVLERIHEADGYRRLEIAVTSIGSDEQRCLSIHAYLKPAEQFDASTVRKGPLSVYEFSDAVLYRPRVSGRV